MSAPATGNLPGATGLSYDASGNPTGINNEALTYDCWGNLTGIANLPGGGSAVYA